MKHKAKPMEFSFASELFNLIVEQTTDGERIQRELDQAKNEKRQEQMKEIQ